MDFKADGNYIDDLMRASTSSRETLVRTDNLITTKLHSIDNKLRKYNARESYSTQQKKHCPKNVIDQRGQKAGSRLSLPRLLPASRP